MKRKFLIMNFGMVGGYENFLLPTDEVVVKERKKSVASRAQETLK